MTRSVAITIIKKVNKRLSGKISVVLLKTHFLSLGVHILVMLFTLSQAAVNNQTSENSFQAPVYF